MAFSGRVPPLHPNRLAVLRAALRSRGIPVLDLTETNPTRVGLDYPADLLSGLSHPDGRCYAPDPRGMASARAAVAADLARSGVRVDPERIFLTSSTSEAYGFLFKLLCDPGDEILVPVPSYPLFEHLASLEAIRAIPAPLDAHAGWRVDVAAIRERVTPRTRAVLVVSPNNPTGSTLDPARLAALAELCAERDLALVGDEVFAEYRFDGRPVTSVLHQDRCLAISLGGLSKSIGLPQVKLAWMAIGGPADAVDEAISRLDLILDTYLPVSTPVQVALPSLLARGAAVRAQIQERLATNLAVLREAVRAAGEVTLLEPDGGWSAVLRVPAIGSEEAIVLDLLERAHVAVMPGYFYDFPFEAWLVLSLLVEPASFADGLDRILHRSSS